MKKRLGLLALLLILVPFALSAFAAEHNTPRNVILLIGDGMGTAQVYASRVLKEPFNIDRFRIAGFSATYSADKLVTDSAAGGTALSTGEKTNNGMLAVKPDGTSLKTALEYAEENGLATGIVATCAVTHATPASFLSHVASRGDQAVVAEQIVNSGVDVLLGGGWIYFVPQSADQSKRKDAKDVLAQLKEKMPVVLSLDELRAQKDAERIAGLIVPEHLPKAAERDYGLAELTSTAIEKLARNDKGFFLMVEGSQIDWGGHDNDAGYILAEMADFDNAVGAALDFASGRDDTLVIVTADHETGGMAVHDGDIAAKTVTETAFTTGSHTATMVPVFSYGPGAAAFGGIQDNTHIGKTIIDYVSKAR